MSTKLKDTLHGWMLGDTPMHIDGVFNLLSKYVTCPQFIGRMQAEILWNIPPFTYSLSMLHSLHVRFIDVG